MYPVAAITLRVVPVPLPTPFHTRTAELCTSLQWKNWAGYHAVCRYDTHHEPEYQAVRHAAGLIDVTPLYKQRVHGPDAEAFLCWVTARNVAKLKLGQVGYGCWCDGQGKVLDDGTITRWDDSDYRVTSAEPSWSWLVRQAEGFDVQIDEISEDLAALALQGPAARDILADASDDDVSALGFFRAMHTTIAGAPVDVTRTGYTGDLGYELWVSPSDALNVWDAVTEAGGPRGLLPLGLDALDVTRIEAGFILLGVDYFSARHTLLPSQKSSPFEIGLGWTVHLKREPFLGSEALRREKRQGSPWSLVGLDIDWEQTEHLFDSFGLPPNLPSEAWRTAVPVYLGKKQVGQATSGVWSPLLKRNLALASIITPHAALKSELEIEVTVEYQRRRVKATVVETPFFNPERKRSNP